MTHDLKDILAAKEEPVWFYTVEYAHGRTVFPVYVKLGKIEERFSVEKTIEAARAVCAS